MKSAKSYLNVLKYRINTQLKRQAVGNYPIGAMIDPTSFCNLRCPSCPTGTRLDLRPTTSIQEELFRATIDEIGDYLFELTMYNWGEPLLHKRTPEMIRYAKEKKIKVSMSSNLSMRLSDDYVDRLVLSGLDTLMVSLDGTTEEIYAKYRRRGNFARVRENMSRIRAARERLGVRSPQIVWQFIAFRHNEHQIADALKFHKQWGADVVSVIPAILPQAQYNGGLEPATSPTLNWYHPDGETQSRSIAALKSGRTCSWLYGGLVLNPNGNLSPCCATTAEKHDFGRYSKGADFFKLWNNTKFRQARGYLANKKNGATKGYDDPEPSSNDIHLIDGMGAGPGIELSADEIICQKCPLPSLMAWVDPVIDRAALDLAKDFTEAKTVRLKSRAVTNYLLMGAPNWNAVLDNLKEEAKRKRGIRFRFGEEIDFTAPSAAIAKQNGWDQPEASGIWTTSCSADLVLRADRKSSQGLVIRAYLQPFIVQAHRRLDVGVSVDGHTAAQWHFDLDAPDGAGPVWCEAVLPPSSRKNRLTIHFAINTPASPFAHGLSEDRRELGVLLKSMQITEVTAADYRRERFGNERAEQHLDAGSA